MIKTKLISALFLLLLITSCSSDEEFIKPSIEDLTEAVYSTVTIQPDSMYMVYSSVNGIIDKQFVEDGDTITKGQGLFSIVNTTPSLNQQNAQLALTTAQQNANPNSSLINSLKEEIKITQIQLENDSVNYYRQKRLLDKGVGTKADFDAINTKYQVSRTKLAMLKDNYNKTIRDLNTTYNQAKINYQIAKKSNDDFLVTSKINGVVYQINKNEGELISVQSPIAMIGSKKNFVIELEIDEVDIARVKLGQKVVITLDAYGKKAFSAIVSKIYPIKDLASQTFKIECLFIEKPNKLYPGLTGEANIIISQKAKVLTLPLAYINDKEMVNTDKGMMPVKIGVKNLEKAEILSGIDTNTIIYPLND